MEIKFKYIFKIDFIISLLMLVGSIIFLIWIIHQTIEVLKEFKSLINYVSVALIFIWVYESFKLFAQDFFYLRVDVEFLLDLVTLFCLMDIGIWIIFKFMQAYMKKNVYKFLDVDNPNRIKEEIEFLVDEQNFLQSEEMEKLYKTLQISALSIKKQKKIIRISFIKNILISLLFFVLGLIIPKFLLMIIYR